MLSYTKKSKVPVKIYGSSIIFDRRMPGSVRKQTRSRLPAAVGVPKIITPGFVDTKVKVKSNEFENTLLQEYKKQRRHTQEVNRLIDDLKSYDQDYKKGY